MQDTESTPDLCAQPVELHMTVEITRAETGEVETFDLVGEVADQRSAS